MGDKTPVLLAFGDRQRATDRRFFRGVVGKFLHDKVVAEGRRAVIVNELENAIETRDRIEALKTGKRPSEEKWKALLQYRGKRIEKSIPLIQEQLDLAVEELIRLTGSTLDIGRRLPRCFPRYGFEQGVHDINRETSKKVVTLFEPQHAETLYRRWGTDIDFDRVKRARWEPDKVKAMITYLKVRFGCQQERDRHLLDFVTKLATENPQFAIVIPRSHIHRGMAKYFADDGIFDTVEHESATLDGFDTEIIVRAYNEALKHIDWELAARRNLTYQRYIDERSHDLLHLFLYYAIGARDYAEERLGNMARGYAVCIEG